MLMYGRFRVMQLDRCGEHHEESHDAGTSKYLQIIAFVDGVIFALQQSAATLRRNMQMAGPSSPCKILLLIW
jgi:hypothetical protein